MNTQSNEQLTVESRKGEFVAVSGGTETTSAEGLLIAAYVAMWAVVFIVVLFTARRQRAVEARLRQVEEALAAAESKAG